MRNNRRVSRSVACRSAAWAAEREDRLPSPPEGKAWKLVWHDEFDGEKLDDSKWDVPEGRRRDGFWSRKAISLDGHGNLVIRALKEGDKYLDGCVRTRGKYEHAHGYYVARVRFQKQPGHWTAFWLYNSSVGKVGNDGRDGTEIDIMEKPSLDDEMNHALHWDGYGKEAPVESPQVQGARDHGRLSRLRPLVDSRGVRLLRRRPPDLADQGRRRLPGAALHQAERRDRQLGRPTSPRRSCPTTSWSTTSACTTWWTRSELRPGGCLHPRARNAPAGRNAGTPQDARGRRAMRPPAHSD